MVNLSTEMFCVQSADRPGLVNGCYVDGCLGIFPGTSGKLKLQTDVFSGPKEARRMFSMRYLVHTKPDVDDLFVEDAAHKQSKAQSQ